MFSETIQRGTFTGMEASVVLTEAYDLAYGLNTGSSQIEQTPEEQITNGSLYEHRLREFREMSINKYFNISFLEYLELPRDQIHSMVKVAKEFMQHDTKAAAAEVTDVKNLLGRNT